jgi:hypothetical protein
MNTKKEVLDKVIGNKYARCIQKPFTDEYFFPEKAVYNAMKEYSDQHIEEYKK